MRRLKCTMLAWPKDRSYKLSKIRQQNSQRKLRGHTLIVAAVDLRDGGAAFWGSHGEFGGDKELSYHCERGAPEYYI